MSRADLDAQRALFVSFVGWAQHQLGQGYSLELEDGTFVDPVTRWCFAGYRAGQAALAAQAPLGESDGAMYARVSRAVSPELSAAAQAEVDAALDRADAEDAQAPIKVELPQPYAGAVVLLETIAEYGAQAKFENGAPTPNADLCRRFAAELRVVAQAPVQGDTADAARLDFMIEKSAFIFWIVRDGTIKQCLVMKHEEGEYFIPLSGESRYFSMPRAAIDAARKAGT